MRHVVQRAVRLVVVLLVVTFFSFSLIHLIPGDPARTQRPFATESQLEEMRQEIGLDRPFLAQYAGWLGDFLSGDFGRDYATGLPVSTAIGQQLGVSLQLVLYVQVLALVLAIPLGVLTAYKAGTWVDRLGSATAFGMIAVPNFVVAYVLIFLFGVSLRWLPTQQYVPFGQDPIEHFRAMLLPALALALGQLAAYMRLLRSDMIQTLQEDYIVAAKAKGIPDRRVLWRHALRPSSFTLLTAAALSVSELIGGAVIIESVFQLPGIGKGLVGAIAQRQFTALQAYVALIAVAYVLLNTAVDLLYGVLDPRVRRGVARMDRRARATV